MEKFESKVLSALAKMVSDFNAQSDEPQTKRAVIFLRKENPIWEK